MATIRLEYGGDIPGWKNAWDHSSRNVITPKYDPGDSSDKHIIDLYERLISIYKHLEEDNHCNFLPNYNEIKYLEFESEEYYTWFLIRWS